jgi:DNA-binding LacI/PurR family transcriptional regulator
MKQRTRKRVTLKEIGQKLGLSARAVSQALSTKDDGTVKVSVQTRRKVQKVARELNYRHDLTAKSLRTGKTDMLGIITSQSFAQLGTRQLHLAMQEIKRIGLTPAVYFIDLSDEEACDQVCDTILDARVDGILLLLPSTPFAPSILSRLLDHGVPVISLGQPTLKNVSKYIADKTAGSLLLAEHFAEEKYKNVTLLCRDVSETNPELEWHTLHIIEGFEKAAAQVRDKGGKTDFHQHRLSSEIAGRMNAASVYKELHPIYAPGYIGMWQLIENKTVPDALICQVDTWALGALRACAEAGIRVPDDMAIAGFEDDFVSAVGYVPLTSVAQPLEELCAAAVRELAGMTRGELQHRDALTMLPCRLVIRQSSVRRKLPGLYLSHKAEGRWNDFSAL